jgi:hypothetical protein
VRSISYILPPTLNLVKHRNNHSRGSAEHHVAVRVDERHHRWTLARCGALAPRRGISTTAPPEHNDLPLVSVWSSSCPPPTSYLRGQNANYPVQVGNPLFAAYVDSAASGTNVTHVNNMKDPGTPLIPSISTPVSPHVVPILPPRILGFAHPSGEIHIQAPGQWYACPGEDNGSSVCEVGDSSLLSFNASDHTGPYGPVTMGADTCNLNQ